MTGADASSPDVHREAPPPLRGLLATALEAIGTRLELASVELEIHLLGVLRTLLWAFAAMLCGLLALAFGVVALIAALWSTHRLLGLLAGSLTFVVLGVVFGWLGVRSFHRHPALLSGSLEQLDSDRRRAAGTP
ncbi:MAG: phage holin family protein [Steroidobacteraceae bacterium]|jgi:uncharacterized membrane protein YqjE